MTGGRSFLGTCRFGIKKICPGNKNQIGKPILPKVTPVTMFHKPENTRVVDSDMELFTASAIMSGRSVPRSPREPDISAKGDLRRVETLLV
jgi:hypothetical protein